MNCLEKKNKTTELVTVRELLSNTKIGQNCFRIPDYQRGYAWNSEFKDLWKDILRVYNNANTKHHYTGMLSLEEMDDEAKKFEYIGGTNAFYVVDGQQRLTSIIIIIKGLLEYIKDETDEDLEDELLSFDMGTYRFDYSRNRNDEAKHYFTERIYKADKNNACADMYLKNINEAKNFIDSTLIKYDARQAKQILGIVLDKIVFNVYFIVKDFDVRVTFETMNNRGKKLSNLELLKNRLMYLTTFIGKEKLGQSNYENKLKEDINNAWKNIYKNICYKDYQLIDDEYLQAHWIVYSSLDKSKGDTYIRQILNKKFAIDEGEFYNYIYKGDYAGAFSCIKDYIKSLEYYSKYWGIINNPKERQELISDNEESKWLDKLSRIVSMKYVKSAVMVVAGDNKLTKEHKIRFYKKLERTLFINKLIGQSSNDFSAITKNARDLLHAKDLQKLDCFNILLQSLEAPEINCDANSIKNRFIEFGLEINKNRNLYYDWDGITYFLFEFNESLKVDNNTKSVDWQLINNNSIEHILPQTPTREYWKIILETVKDETEINRVTNSLGNLLLLSRGENSEMQNYSFPTKKSINVDSNKFAYIFGSRSAQKVAEKEYWSLFEIYNRQVELYEFMYDRWIKSDELELSKEEFIDIVKENKLLIDKYSDLSKEVKQKIDGLDLSEERKIESKKEKESKEWFKELEIFFNNDLYGLAVNSKKVACVENKFTFTLVDNILKCGFKKNDYKYYLDYDISTGIMKIYKYDLKGIETGYISNPDLLDTDIQYYVRTFNRYLRRAKNKPNAIIYDENNIIGNIRDDSKHYTEEEHFKIRKANKEMIDLFYILKEKLLEKYKGTEEYCTQNYIAFKKLRNYAEMHIYKDSILVNIRDVGIESKLGHSIPDSYNWVWKYQFSIQSVGQIEEAIKLISASYDIVQENS